MWPVSPSCRMLRIAPTSVATTGVPVSEASARVAPILAHMREIAERTEDPYLEGVHLAISGIVAFQEGRFADAESGYEHYLKYRPKNVTGICNLALVKVRLKKTPEAEALLG